MAEQPRQILIDAFHEGLLDALLERLRAEGFGIGLDEVFQANAIVRRWLADETPTLPRLRALLGPLLCIDAEEQAKFRQVFDEVAQALNPQPVGPLPPLPIDQIRGRVARRTLIAIAAVLAAVAIVSQIPRVGPPAELPEEIEPPAQEELPPQAAAPSPPVEPLPALDASLFSDIVEVRGRVVDLLGDPVVPAHVEVRALGEISALMLPSLGFEVDRAHLVSADGSQVVVADSNVATVFRSGSAGIRRLPIPDGSRLVAIENGTVLIVGREAPELDADWPRIYHTRNPAFLSPSGRWVFETGAAEWTIHDAEKREVRFKLGVVDPVARADVIAARFSPDERKVHVATRGGLLRVEWGEEQAAQVVELRSERPITAARFSRNGASVAYQTADGRVEAKFAGGRNLSLTEEVRSFDIADQRLVTVVSDTLRVDDENGERRTRELDGIRNAWVSDDGRVVLVETFRELSLLPADLSDVVANGLGRGMSLRGVVPQAVTMDEEFRAVVMTNSSGARRFRFRDVFEQPEDGVVAARLARGSSFEVFVADPRYGAAEPLTLERSPDEGATTLDFRAELSPVPAGWRQRFGRNPVRVRALAFALPVAFGFGWWVRRRLMRTAVLQARRPLEPPVIVREGFAAALDGLYRDATAVRAGIEARRPRPMGLADLDPAATVQASAQRAGIFSPRFAPRMAMPSYVVLIDRRSVWDQLAKQMEEMVARLEDVGIAIARFDFDRDPRTVRALGSERRVDLSELASTYGGSRLLLVGDGAGLFDGRSGAIAAWAGIFAEWPERALLTPVEACHWSRREAELGELGFRVVPASPDGLLRFLESLTDHGAAERQAWEWSPPLPASLEEDAIAHLSRRVPEQAEMDALCEDLRDYLGPDGYRWLCALAAYPSLEWELTLYLGQLLTAADGRPLQREDRLLRLARLPWLRYGQMPGWLRARLLDELPEADESTVRAALAAVLDGAEHTGQTPFRLDFAFERRRSDAARAGKAAADAARAQPPGDPLRDPVLVSFLSGRRIAPTDVRAPNRLRRLLFVEGRGAFGVRGGVVIAAAALVGLAVSLAADRGLEQFRDSAQRRPSAISQVWSEASGHLIETVDVPEEMSRVLLCGSPPALTATGPEGAWRRTEDGELRTRVSGARSYFCTWKEALPVSPSPSEIVAAASLSPDLSRVSREAVVVARVVDGRSQLDWLDADRVVSLDGEVRSLRGLEQAAVAGRVQRFPLFPAQGFAARVTENMAPDASWTSRLLRAVGLPTAQTSPHLWTPDPLVDALWAPVAYVPGFVTLSEVGLASRWVEGAFEFTYGGPQESTSMDANVAADRLVTGGGGFARVWRLSDGTLLATIAGELPVRDVAISRDGSTIAVLRDDVSLWSEHPTREDLAQEAAAAATQQDVAPPALDADRARAASEPARISREADRLVKEAANSRDLDLQKEIYGLIDEATRLGRQQPELEPELSATIARLRRAAVRIMERESSSGGMQRQSGP